MVFCGTVVPQLDFQNRGSDRKSKCNTQMRNVIESSKGKEPAATQGRSQEPSQGANSFAWSAGLLGAMPPPAPRSRLPVHDPRFRSGRARPDARCPPPRPRGAWKTKQRSSRDRSQAPGCAALRLQPARSLRYAR